ncbi:IclR family transcriptional regulator [Lactobacillus corticis]|uniref:IclR family transcriptional regulator n=1 Tax=Lactobacillus corticis TaxID=2201249 RepID=A0A916QI80_9LACO|nr:IclR family transcriptional regulator [Lactobacillus corticis]GFZ27429.1 IclR family transcriptional regulator [Lactobacillus corticis]
MTEKNLYGAVILKAKDLLDIISDSEEPLTLKEISSKMTISKSTVLKILQTLEYCGLVRATGVNKKYCLGTIFIKYGDQAVHSFNLEEVAMPFLNKLRDETTEAVNLGIVENNKVVLLDRAKSTNNIRFDLVLGGTMNMYSSAMGKAILACYSDKAINSYIDHTALVKMTKNTIISRDELLSEINIIRKQGYAIDNVENQDGIYCIGFALMKNEHIFGAFSISAPLFRTNQEKINDWIALGFQTQKQILDKL